MGHSRSHDLSPIIISFPIVLVALGHVLHVLLSSPPRPEASRLACLNRIPIAVAAGRINRSQIFDFSSWMDERNWQFTMFHRCPAKRHTQSNDPSNGTFVASSTADIHYATCPDRLPVIRGPPRLAQNPLQPTCIYGLLLSSLPEADRMPSDGCHRSPLPIGFAR